jgi:hypothetical protein
VAYAGTNCSGPSGQNLGSTAPGDDAFACGPSANASGVRATAIGYQRAIGDNASFTIGASFTDDESMAGVGFGYGW